MPKQATLKVESGVLRGTELFPCAANAAFFTHMAGNPAAGRDCKFQVSDKHRGRFSTPR
jgi:hypothetical protein